MLIDVSIACRLASGNLRLAKRRPPEYSVQHGPRVEMVRPRCEMNETIWVLRRCSLFERLSPAEMGRLDARASLRTFARGELVFFPGEPAESLLVVARGRIKIKSVTPEGRESILAFIDEGGVFGELALIDPAPRVEFAEAVEPSKILAVPRTEIMWLMSRRPDIALGVTKLMGLRLQRVENRLRNILFRSNRQRVVSLLLELLTSHGRADRDGWWINLRLSHQDLANLIGATRETVTATLGHLKREGLIEIRRQQIRVVKRARLVAETEATDVPAPPEPARERVKPGVVR